MQVTQSEHGALSQRQLWLLFLGALTLHVLPLVLADYPYMDDIWRSLVAGRIQGEADSWAAQGRVLIDWFFAALGGGGALDLFPLPLLLVLPVVAKALAALTAHYFERPGMSHALVVLALWYNPFFLQNLSYQYDAPGMALALAACVWAIVSGAGAMGRWLLGSVLIAAALALYQPSLSVFAILCCVEVIHRSGRDTRFAQVAGRLGARIVQLLVGGVIYWLTAYQLLNVPRTAMLPLNAQWPGEMLARLEIIAQFIVHLATPGNTWLIVALVVLALVGLQLIVRDVMLGPQTVKEKAGLVFLLLLQVPATLLLIPGMILLFSSFGPGPRMLMGAGGALLLLLLLARRALVAVHPQLAWGVALPLLLLLSLSFALGRVMVLQKELQQRVMFTLASAIDTYPALQAIHRFHLHRASSKGLWLPAASGTLEALPVLRDIHHIRYWLLPESTPRAGLDGFYGTSLADTRRLLSGHPSRVVDTRLFTIYVVDGEGHVVMKSPPAIEHLYE